MKLTSCPERIVVIPAEYYVEFDEGSDYPNYVGGDGGYSTMNDFRPDIADWLNLYAPGWSASFDRGDWGEGPASVKLNFAAIRHAVEFVKQFETIPCDNCKNRGDCPHNNKAVVVAQQRYDGKAQCNHCDKGIHLLNSHNQDEWLKAT